MTNRVGRGFRVHRPVDENPLAGIDLQSLLASPRVDKQRKALRLGAALLGDDVLETMLRHAADATARNAALEMTKMRGARGRALALRLLTDDDPDVALQAVLALDALQEESDLVPLAAAARRGDTNIAHAALLAVGHSANPAAREVLHSFTAGDPWLQAAAIEAMGNLRDFTAVPLLHALIDDPFVGALAIDAIGRIGGREALEALSAAWLNAAPGSFESHDLLAALVAALEGPNSPAAPLVSIREEMGRRFPAAGEEERELLARAIIGAGQSKPDEAVLGQFFAAAPPGDHPLPRCFHRHPELAASLVEHAPQWALTLAAEGAERIDPAVLDRLLDRVLQEETSSSDASLLATALLRRDWLPHETAGRIVDAVIAGNASGRFLFHALVRQFAPVLDGALEARNRPPMPENVILAAALQATPETIIQVVQSLVPDERPAALAELAPWPAIVAALPWEWWVAETPSLLPVAARLSRSVPLPQLASVFRAELSHSADPEIVHAVISAGGAEAEASLVQHAMSDASPAVLEALGRCRGVTSAILLRGFVRDGGSSGRPIALRALARRAEPEDLPLFLDAVDDPDWLVRHACARALAPHASAPAVLSALVQLSCDPVQLVSDCALSALETPCLTR
jgi:HEAT repeat protein